MTTTTQDRSDQGFDTASLFGGNRDTVTTWTCERPQVISVKEGDSGRGRAVPCRSRSCPDCRPGLDRRDVSRILFSLTGDTVFHFQVHRSAWDRVRQDGHRKGYHPIKMASSDTNYIEVVSDGLPSFIEPETVVAKTEAHDLIASLVADIPAGSDNRLTGVGLITIKDWEIMVGHRKETDEPTEVIQAPRGTTLSEVETAAIQLQVPYYWEGNSLFFPRWEDLVKVNQALLDKDTSRGWE